MTAAIRTSTLCALLVAVWTPSSDGAAPIWARVWPLRALAPATVRIEVLIEADAANRALHIVVDSGEHYRSSTIALEGARAARFHFVQYRAMPAGQYGVEVLLVDQEGVSRAMERQWFEIIP
jgi:hypothetical protein